MMLRKFFLLSLFILYPLSCANAKELNLVKGEVYLLNFQEEILNINADTQNIDAQIVHTIFDDKKQIILALKTTENSFLQVQTEKDLINYKIKNNTKSSKELIKIDFPPVENLTVDIFDGRN